MRRGRVDGRGAARRRRDEGPARDADGRSPDHRAASSGRRHTWAPPSSRSRTSRRSATRVRPPCVACRSRSGPARSWASRRWRATARASWPRSSPGAALDVAAGSSWPARTSPTGRSAEDRSRRPTSRGPQCRRQRTEPLAGRQPDHEALPHEADRARLGDRRRRRAQGARRPEGRLRHLGAVDRHEVRLLSGGNLQRLILAREIESEPRLMIAVQPTRGLDVGAVETSTSCSSGGARRARRSCSCRRSWTS